MRSDPPHHRVRAGPRRGRRHPTASGQWVSDEARRNSVELALNVVPFAGIAFLWFIGVVRDRIGEAEDRFFATVFLGSGLLFIAMLFAGAASGSSLLLSNSQSLSSGASPYIGREQPWRGCPRRCAPKLIKERADRTPRS